MNPSASDSPKPSRRPRRRRCKNEGDIRASAALTGGTFPSALAALHQLARSYEKHADILPSMGALQDSMEERAKAVNAGDFTIPETMLVSQATALDLLFSSLVKESTGWKDGHEPHERVLKLALRAQAQSARTLEILGGMKLGPRVVLTKQLNAATNQIVNNNEPLARDAGHPERIVRSAQKTVSPPASPSLPETSTHFEHAPLDTGIPTPTKPTHQDLAPVEPVHRPANAPGKNEK